MAENQETVFVAKTVKVKNSKVKDYFLYRMTIPKEVAEKMELGASDHLLLKAKKAEWYHLLDWSQMDKGWDMLSDKAKGEILSLGLPAPKGVVVSPNVMNLFTCTQSYTGSYSNSAGSYILQQKIVEEPLSPTA
jgi:hypothetical protein